MMKSYGPVASTMTYYLDTRTWSGYSEMYQHTKTKFLGQSFKNLEPEQDR